MAKFYLLQKNANQGTKSEDKEKLLSLTNVGKMLGVYEFITGQSYTIGCKSIDLCLIQTLKWS